MYKRVFLFLTEILGICRIVGAVQTVTIQSQHQKRRIKKILGRTQYSFNIFECLLFRREVYTICRILLNLHILFIKRLYIILYIIC